MSVEAVSLTGTSLTLRTFSQPIHPSGNRSNHSSKEPKRPRDIYQLAKFIVDLATGEPLPEPISELATQEETPSDALRQAAVGLGRRDGLKGGKARAAKLTPEQRSEIARKATRARWPKG